MPVTRENCHDVVAHHAPDAEGIARISRIRLAAESMIRAIFDNCPPCADQTAAIRHVREAMMTANASIALGGKV